MQLGPPAPRRITRTGWGRPASLAAALLLLPSCSAHDDATGAAAPIAGDSPAVARQAGAPGGPRLELRSRVTRVAGSLSDVRRKQVERQVRATVADYLRSAFADGERRPFGAFVPALRRQAAGDSAVLRSTQADGTTRATVWLAVAAPRGRAVGVTARLAVTVPDGTSTSTLTGRLLLTKDGSGWRVFGYDLARGDR